VAVTEEEGASPVIIRRGENLTAKEGERNLEKRDRIYYCRHVSKMILYQTFGSGELIG